MSAVVDLTAWRARRSGHPSGAAVGGPDTSAQEEGRWDDPAVDRLDHAVQRLRRLVVGAVDGKGRLESRIETELLAIIGELTIGLVGEAATRAERLAEQLAR